jgi:hypothetical protein
MGGPEFRDPFRQRPLQKRSVEVQFSELGIDPMGRSPLEQSLGRAILHLLTDPAEFGPPGFINLFLPQYEIHSEKDLPPVPRIKEGVINVAPGTWWASYQADFLFCVKAPKACRTAWGVLECDGHSFHEKTPEQVSHDRQRDRDFQAAGSAVLRFPGWQVLENPKNCAREAIKILLRQSAARRAA